MKKTRAKPKACVMWGLYDSAGALEMVERERGRLEWSSWRRVRVVPLSKAADMAAFLRETSPKRRKRRGP